MFVLARVIKKYSMSIAIYIHNIYILYILFYYVMLYYYIYIYIKYVCLCRWHESSCLQNQKKKKTLQVIIVNIK